MADAGRQLGARHRHPRRRARRSHRQHHRRPRPLASRQAGRTTAGGQQRERTRTGSQTARQRTRRRAQNNRLPGNSRPQTQRANPPIPTRRARQPPRRLTRPGIRKTPSATRQARPPRVDQRLGKTSGRPRLPQLPRARRQRARHSLAQRHHGRTLAARN